MPVQLSRLPVTTLSALPSQRRRWRVAVSPPYSTNPTQELVFPSYRQALRAFERALVQGQAMIAAKLETDESLNDDAETNDLVRHYDEAIAHVKYVIRRKKKSTPLSYKLGTWGYSLHR